MSKPKHKRCGICGVVTSRYSHTQDAGAFVVKVWVRDPKNGEATRENVLAKERTGPCHRQSA